MRTLRAFACVSASVAVALSLTSCGSSVAGSATPAEIDVRKLDIGNYSPDPSNILDKYIPLIDSGRELAIMRLGDKIANGDEIDPSLIYNTGVAIDEPKDRHTLGDSKPFIEALEQNGMLYGLQMHKRQRPDDAPVVGDKLVNLTVYQFPDDNSAKAAADTFESIDLAFAQDQNQPVHLDKYPDARSHWRPGIRTMGSWIAVGHYMLEVFIRVPAPQLPDLTSFIQHIYDVQVPMLRSLPPLSKKEILHLPYDPEGMLRRTLDPQKIFMPDLLNYAYYTAHSARNFTNPAGRAMMDLGKVDAASQRVGVTMLWRSRDVDSAREMFEEMRRQAKGPVDPPSGITSSYCDQGPADSFDNGSRFRCVIRYDRYVARLISNQLKDAQQLAAAQYAVLANSWQ
ncbi:hypothetical protein NONO_c09750 [Nocardia nova SH22a]|uniref:Lipoprotein n=2 Tax=Nocardia nova TaxID=37330 RepID=W5T976_9NOCA|nr:hypothetical protein NONO_c09750 [Nocardia nova SH22a]